MAKEKEVKCVAISEAFIKRAYSEACSEWKKLIKKEAPSLFKDTFDDQNVYIFEGRSRVSYKIHYADSKWGWVSLDDSRCMANGTWPSGQACLDSIRNHYSGKVYSAYSVKEYYAGIKEEVNI